VLPVEERALRDGRRARERQGPAEHGARRDQRQPAWSCGHPCEQRECHRQDGEPAAELVATGKQRRGPPRGEEEEHNGEERPARSDGEPDGKGESEDRDEDDGVHLGMLSRVERHAVVVEVEEAAREPGAERAEEGVPARPERRRRD
jgi:hypothetical protein